MKPYKFNITTIAEASQALSRADRELEKLKDFFQSTENHPRVWIGDGNNSVELTVRSASGPDREDEWLCLLKWIRGLSIGRSGVVMQRGIDWESRITTKCPTDVLDNMIGAIESED